MSEHSPQHNALAASPTYSFGVRRGSEPEEACASTSLQPRGAQAHERQAASYLVTGELTYAEPPHPNPTDKSTRGSRGVNPPNAGPHAHTPRAAPWLPRERWSRASAKQAAPRDKSLGTLVLQGSEPNATLIDGRKRVTALIDGRGVSVAEVICFAITEIYDEMKRNVNTMNGELYESTRTKD